MSTPVLIWGAGAIGGTIGAHIARSGQPVLFVDQAADHVAAIASKGLAITGPFGDFTVSANAVTPVDVRGQFDTVFLCVKSQDTVAAMQRVALHVARNGCVVSLQNGLCELAIAESVGKERAIGAFINFGSDYLGPGHISYAGRGAVVLGELDGRMTSRITRLTDMFKTFESSAVATSNIWGYLWAKNAYMALLFASSLTDAPIADTFAVPEHRPVLIGLAREVLSIADACGIAPEAFDGFNPAAFGPDASLQDAEQSLDDLVVFHRGSAKKHSGIYRDLVVRRRKTEVDAILGAVIRLGAEAAIATPLIARLSELIHDIEDGRRQPGSATLDALGASARDRKGAADSAPLRSTR